MIVPARWAVWSKNPGDQSDYRLVAGGADHASRFAELVRAYQPGTPELGRDKTGSLPWVTVAPDGTGTQVMLAVLDWSGGQDGSGRPIAATHLYLLPCSAVVEHGHLALYRAAAAQPLQPPPATPLVQLPVAADDNGCTRPGADWCAAVAALVLEGRVVITRPGARDAGERMAVVDAVSRLLPAGYRADLSVASWASTPEQRPHRLCFGPYAEGDLAEVQWDAVPDPRTEPARRYLALARKYLARDGADRLVEHLGTHSRARLFADGPEAAIAAIAELDVPDAVITEIRRGDGTTARAAAALEQYGPAAFGTDVDAVYRFLLASEPVDEDALALLVRSWSHDLMQAVVTVARASSQTHRGRLASAFLDVAARSGDLDDYLTALIAPDGHEVPRNLVQICVDTWFLHPGEYPVLRDILLANPGVGTVVVMNCRDSRPADLIRLLAWLADVPDRRPAWLQVLIAAVWDVEPPLPTSTVEEALRQSPPSAQLAFDLALEGQRLSALDDVVWRQLAHILRSRGRDTAARLLLASVKRAADGAAAGADRARLDVLMVSAGRPVGGVPADVDAARDYGTVLGAAAAAIDPAGRDELFDRTAAAVAGGTLAGPDAAHVVAAFVDAVLHRRGGLPMPKLATVLAGAFSGPDGPELLALVVAGSAWAPFAKTQPAMAEAAMDAAMRTGPIGAIARCWAAVLVGADPSPHHPRSIWRLRSWAHLTQPDALANLIDTTAVAVAELRPHDDRVWHRAVIDAVMKDRMLGDEAAAALATSLLRHGDQDERHLRATIGQLTTRIAEAKKQLAADNKRLFEVERSLANLMWRQQSLQSAQDGSAGRPFWLRWWRAIEALLWGSST